ncbi:MAG: PhzF family phenazine biosynthesis protein [Altererythrobacter sp.]|nr:PhzF family phenazine biosynthesis protein [Altererythrobacter sp.]NNK45269.1 PhzF family phenazine biosynthesis protein [Altererythrobacter sp.]
MHAKPIFIDAFAGVDARGNRAAVLMCDTLPSAPQMQARAAQLNQPATAFVCLNGHAGLHPIRWFGAAREIALCGHGALAAGHVLLTQSAREEARLKTADGREVTVRKAEGENRYELRLPAILTQPRDWRVLAKALGGPPPLEIRWHDAGYAMVVYEEAAIVRALTPDWAALAALGNLQVSASATGASEADIVSRVFSSGREDAATGSAHAVLATYWCARLGQDKFTSHQASAGGGRFECRIDSDMVWLGGECRPVT